MPRCLMAKKWKAYPWTHQELTKDTEEEEEIIDVVGDSQGGSCWGPSSPSEGATAPSPPPGSPNGTNILYNGYLAELPTSTFTSSCIQKTDHSVIQQTVPSPSYTTLNTVKTGNQPHQTYTPLLRKKPLSVTLTSTGAQLSLPPKKKDIYRPYCLEDKQLNEDHLSFLNSQPTIRVPAEEDLHAAHAILDLSASTTIFVPAPPLSPPQPHSDTQQAQSPSPTPPQPPPPPPPPLPPTGALQIVESNFASPPSKVPLNDITQEHDNIAPTSPLTGKNATTVAYTYEAFFVSDGRSKKRSNADDAVPVKVTKNKPKYTCCECGKQYATSSNLSRHKQTHRSLDSQAAKRCPTCGKAYVSMPALSMHILTHKLGYSCSTCGKQFSRPWLLQGHFRSHTGEKPYGCAHCGKAFADRSNLRAHMQTHSVDKNFECPKCHKTFALKSYLNKHLESACLKEETTVKQDNKKSSLSSSDSSVI